MTQSTAGSQQTESAKEARKKVKKNVLKKKKIVPVKIEKKDVTTKQAPKGVDGRIKADFSHTKYQIIKQCAQELGWHCINQNKPPAPKEKKDPKKDKERENENPYLRNIGTPFLNQAMEKRAPMVDLYWHDLYIEPSRLNHMKSFQRVNHFPAMSGIT